MKNEFLSTYNDLRQMNKNELEELKQQLEEKVAKSEVFNLFDILMSSKYDKAGLTNLFVLNVGQMSSNGFEIFCNLLNPSEYFRCFSFSSSGGNVTQVDQKYKVIYLTLGKGIVLELSLCEKTMPNLVRGYTQTTLSGRCYVDLKNDLQVEIVNREKFSKILRISKTDEHVGTAFETSMQEKNIFEMLTRTDRTIDGLRLLNEVLVPVSLDELQERFYKSLESSKTYSK